MQLPENFNFLKPCSQDEPPMNQNDQLDNMLFQNARDSESDN